MFGKIRHWGKLLISRYPNDVGITVIRNTLGLLTRRPTEPSKMSKLRVAVECIEDRFYFGLFTAICQHLHDAKGAVGELVVVRSINGAVGNGWQQRLARSTLFGLIISTQWVRAFRGVIDRVAYRSLSPFNPFRDMSDWFLSRAIWQRMQTDSAIADLRVLGVPVGDLIIDSYLRFKPSPRFDSGDPFVLRLIWQAHRDVRRARAYFRTKKPKIYLTSYSTYIEHGIAVRVALLEKIRVRSFGNFQQFGKELALSDWFHTPDTSMYKSIFETLDKQEERLLQAEQQLTNRLAGGIDAATSYMRVSAYAAKSAVVPNVAGAVVVFLHDFYDSPHIYHDLVFDDFWTWTCFTIEALQDSGQKFYVKAHPNQISLSNEVMKSLLAKYPDLPLLSSSITNVQLVEAGMLCGVTVYGTVGHELAFLGVPTIACARHPHHVFDFCRTARTAEQYRQYLLSPQELPNTKAEMRRQALTFYYMHNLYGDDETLLLRNKFVSFWKACVSETISNSDLALQFRTLRDSPAFKAAVERL